MAEPYVLAADVSSCENLGRAGWTWYTGSASWCFKTMLEGFLGVSVKDGNIVIDPAPPKALSAYDVIYDDKKSKYIFHFAPSDKYSVVENGVDLGAVNAFPIKPDENREFFVKYEESRKILAIKIRYDKIINMDLFEYANQQNDGLKPLAERMRPQTLNEFIGQEHIVGEGSLLRRAIAADRLGSCIFYGPPGTGKTTLANIIAKNTNSHFEILNAVSSGVADAKRVIEEAKNRLMMYGKKTYLLLDECHRWNKAQSDSVLSAIEQGYIVFIGSTTENPYVSMTKAIVSRCRLFEFHSLTDKDVLKALNRAINDKRGLLDMNVVAEEGALEHLAWASGGDVRTALNALELAAVTTSASADGAIHITKEIAAQSIQNAFCR